MFTRASVSCHATRVRGVATTTVPAQRQKKQREPWEEKDQQTLHSLDSHGSHHSWRRPARRLSSVILWDFRCFLHNWHDGNLCQQHDRDVQES